MSGNWSSNWKFLLAEGSKAAKLNWTITDREMDLNIINRSSCITKYFTVFRTFAVNYSVVEAMRYFL